MNKRIFLITAIVLVLVVVFIFVIKPVLDKAKEKKEDKKKLDRTETDGTAKTVEPPRNMKPPFKGVVTASVLNVRDTPSLSGKVLTKIAKGRSVDVMRETGEWYELGLPPLVRAFVHKNYIKSVK